MVYLFLADGFEEIEALCPLDLLRRAGIEVVTVGVGSKLIHGAHGIDVSADISTDEAAEMLESKKLDMVILPGGMPGTLNLKNDYIVNKFVDKAYSDGKFIAAICAAPSILGEKGLLRSVRATCFPGFEDSLEGASLAAESVVTDGRFITAKGMGVALEFGLALISALISPDKANEIRSAVQAK